jgi:murein DD-endopeptidase MepM/ murein hydrolase activator NlpD
MEADFTHLIYSYIGFNFILTAIALGGFFIVASRRSLLLLLFSIPVIALIISSLHGLFSSIGLPLYSLPFNLVVLLILYAINQRVYAAKLIPVKYQHYSPEINHYKYFNYIERYKRETYFHISLPFMGTWTVAQGHSGTPTHTDDYRYAWDFDIRDENNKTYRGNGYELKDYYCYDLPVVAPGQGYVVALIDNIDDNIIGQVDMKNNWGNTIIIKHQDFLFSKLSHLKKGTFKVKLGDWVTVGQVIAHSGNSGRSPEPHLHFQLQATPYVGSKTIRYPLSYYLKKEDKLPSFKTFDIPQQGETISKPQISPLLSEAFQLIPGKVLTWEVQISNRTEKIDWEVFTNSYNQSYIYCRKTKAVAYFSNNGTLFYFTDYYGQKNTLLHHFYKATYKVILGQYPDISIQDTLEITDTLPKPLTFFHDFFAPAFHFLKANFTSKSSNYNNPHNPTKADIFSECESRFFTHLIRKSEYNLRIEKDDKLRLTLTCKQANIIAQCENELF